jgi:cell division protease FtsH
VVEEAGAMAHHVLSGSREALDRVAGALMERETLTLEEVEEVVGTAPLAGRRTDGAGGRARAGAGASGPPPSE